MIEERNSTKAQAYRRIKDSQVIQCNNDDNEPPSLTAMQLYGPRTGSSFVLLLSPNHEVY